MVTTGKKGLVLSAVLGSVVIAAIVGVAVLNRGPDPSLYPDMVPTPVTLSDGHAIHVGRYEVTVAEWNRCHAAGACELEVRTRRGMDPETTPATGLSHVDVRQYLDWINRETGQNFRLPTLAEWQELAADVLSKVQSPLFTDPSLTWASSYLTENLPGRALKPTGSFSVNVHGIADLNGSVWEWTRDCFNDADPDRCAAFYVGGEHIAAVPFLVRDPARGGCAVGSPPAHLGMRLVSDRPVPTS